MRLTQGTFSFLPDLTDLSVEVAVGESSGEDVSRQRTLLDAVRDAVVVAISVALTANSASSTIRKRGCATDAATASSIVTVLWIGRSGAAWRISVRMPSTTLAGVAVRATNATNRRNPLSSCWYGT